MKKKAPTTACCDSRAGALCGLNRTPPRLHLRRRQVSHLETNDTFVEHAHAAGLELLESLDKTTSMATHFQTLMEVHHNGVLARTWQPFRGKKQNFCWSSSAAQADPGNIRCIRAGVACTSPGNPLLSSSAPYSTRVNL